MIIHPKTISRKQAIIEIGNKKRLLREEKQVIIDKVTKFKRLFVISLIINVLTTIICIYR